MVGYCKGQRQKKRTACSQWEVGCAGRGRGWWVDIFIPNRVYAPLLFLIRYMVRKGFLEIWLKIVAWETPSSLAVARTVIFLTWGGDRTSFFIATSKTIENFSLLK
uniref:Uncharacterized protein n=1 Tax=Morchella brunnea TaxID=1174671 RepID=A0A8K1I5J3_9PEZI|nr:hypothetical protein LK370_mgp130 [Morchella brunnea]UBU98390.1 hypothetical protein [Morchella brunnea]